MSEKVQIGKRFTVVIPKSLRKKMNVSEGQQVVIRVEEGKLIIEPMPIDPYGVLERIVREPYNESRDEKNAAEWIKKRAPR